MTSTTTATCHDASQNTSKGSANVNIKAELASESDSDSNSAVLLIDDPKERKAILSCSICDMQSRNHYQMMQHVMDHSVERPWKCMKCENQPAGKHQVIRHSPHCLEYAELVRSCDDCHDETLAESTALMNKPHQCTFCTYSSRSLIEVVAHIKKHVRTKPHASSDSEDEFLESIVTSQLEQYSVISNPNSHPDRRKLVYCPDCGLNCVCRRKLLQSLVRKCSHCIVECANEREYATHMKRMHPNEKLKCSVCPKTYTKLETLTNHMRTHEGTMKCMFCNYCATSVQRLQDHMRLHRNRLDGATRAQPAHAQLNAYFYCPQCHIRSFSYNYIVAHCHRHVLCAPYNCKKCGEIFQNAPELSQHYIDHIDKVAIMCELCKRKFPSSEELSVHRIQFHREKRAYSCETCGYTFGYASHLARHQLIHTQEKPYMCDLCGREFNQLANLKSHKISNHQTG